MGIISKAASARTLPPEYPGIFLQGWLLAEMWILADVADAAEVEILADVVNVEIVGEVVKVSIVAIYRVQHPSLHYIVAVDCAHGVTILSHRGQ